MDLVILGPCRGNKSIRRCDSKVYINADTAMIRKLVTYYRRQQDADSKVLVGGGID